MKVANRHYVNLIWESCKAFLGMLRLNKLPRYMHDHAYIFYVVLRTIQRGLYSSTQYGTSGYERGHQRISLHNIGVVIALILFACTNAPAVNVNTGSSGGGLDSAEIMTVVRDSTTNTLIVDVDSTARDKYDVLMWTGSALIFAPYDTTLEFSISSFTDNASSPQLIGATDKKWLDVGDISFSAAHLNGPATICTVQVYGTGISEWATALTLSSCSGPTTNTDTVDYPTSRGNTAYFRLISANAGGEWDTATTSVTFWNYIFYGADADSTPDEATIEALTNDLDNDHTQNSFSITGVGSGDHIIFACPAGFSNLTTTNFGYGDETSDDGSYRLTLPMTQVETALSITNSAGEVENYDVYSSNIEYPQSDASSTLRTTNALRNRIKWGVIEDTNGIDESDVHALDADSVISDDETRTFTVTAGEGEYIAYSYPSRLGAVIFYVGGFAGGFQGAKTISVTNANGYTENYYFYQSTNAKLGETEVTTQ